MPEALENLFEEPEEPYEGIGERGQWVYSKGFLDQFKELEIKEYKFEKGEFTERVWKVLSILAQKKAKNENYNYTGFCGPEHIILTMDSEKDKGIEPILSNLGLDLNSFKNEIIKEIEKRRAEMEMSKKKEVRENLEKEGHLPLDVHFQRVLILASELAKKTNEKITTKYLFDSIITESIEDLIEEKKEKNRGLKDNKDDDVDIKRAISEIIDDLRKIGLPSEKSVISAVLLRNPEIIKKIEEQLKKSKGDNKI